MSEDQLDDLYGTKNKWRYPHSDTLPSTVKALYGEVTREGVEAMITHFPEFKDPNTVFYDLGSGYGRAVMHVSISCPIKRAVGIEYIDERNDVAIASSLKYTYASANKPEFLQEDLFELDLSEATVIYVDNTEMSFCDLFRARVLPRLPSGCLLLARSFRGRGWRELKEGSIISPTTYMADMKLHWGYIK